MTSFAHAAGISTSVREPNLIIPIALAGLYFIADLQLAHDPPGDRTADLLHADRLTRRRVGQIDPQLLVANVHTPRAGRQGIRRGSSG